MTKVYRVVAFDPKTNEEQVYPHHDAFYSDFIAEEFALYLLTADNYIVSIIEVLRGLCKHCDRPIYEKPGWIAHRWIHINNDAHTCYLPHLPKAEAVE